MEQRYLAAEYVSVQRYVETDILRQSNNKQISWMSTLVVNGKATIVFGRILQQYPYPDPFYLNL